MEAILRSIHRDPEGMPLDQVIHKTRDGETVTVVFRSQKKQEEPKTQKVAISGQSVRNGRDYVIKVKQWMTRKSSPEFDFMSHWNGDIPMPMRVMRGRVLKETRGMVYMELTAEPHKTDYCMRCGKALTHPVSRLYGIGPECGKHYHLNPFETEEELMAALDEVKAKLAEVRWQGWIAKSGIECAMEVNHGRDPSRA